MYDLGSGQVIGMQYELYDSCECHIKRREKLISAKLQETPTKLSTFFWDSIPFIREPWRTHIIYTCLGYIYTLVGERCRATFPPAV